MSHYSDIRDRHDEETTLNEIEGLQHDIKRKVDKLIPNQQVRLLRLVNKMANDPDFWIELTAPWRGR